MSMPLGREKAREPTTERIKQAHGRYPLLGGVEKDTRGATQCARRSVQRDLSLDGRQAGWVKVRGESLGGTEADRSDGGPRAATGHESEGFSR